MTQYGHIPVLAHEVISLLSPCAGQIIVDCTFGAGGYTERLLSSGATVIAVDKDPSVLGFASQIKQKYPNHFQFVQGDFADLTTHLSNIGEVDAIVADLGVSSMQLDNGKRGFSFMHDAMLDMRMSQEGQSAYDVINQTPEDHLANIIYKFGEEKLSRKIAKRIVEYRQNYGEIKSTTQLAEVIRSSYPYNPKAKIDPATKTFQAIRIFINNELGALEALLEASLKQLKIGGKIAIISFHSLEDSIVKNFFKTHSAPKIAKSKYAAAAEEISHPLTILTKKPITPTREEVLGNPRARSAKMRIAMKLTNWEGEENVEG